MTTPTTRCKFQCSRLSLVGKGAGRIQEVTLEALYDPATKPEDRHYAAATPDGKMQFTVTNPNVIGFFEPGEAYYIDIRKAEPATA